jgi:hypothetical protein
LHHMRDLPTVEVDFCVMSSRGLFISREIQGEGDRFPTGLVRISLSPHLSSPLLSSICTLHICHAPHFQERHIEYLPLPFSRRDPSTTLPLSYLITSLLKHNNSCQSSQEQTLTAIMPLKKSVANGDAGENGGVRISHPLSLPMN